MKKTPQFNQRYVEIDITKIGSRNVEKSTSQATESLGFQTIHPIEK